MICWFALSLGTVDGLKVAKAPAATSAIDGTFCLSVSCAAVLSKMKSKGGQLHGQKAKGKKD